MLFLYRWYYLIYLLFPCLLGWGDEGSKAILVTGGAGYIGTQVCKVLQEEGFLPIIYDNLSTGHLENIRWGIFEKGDISDRKKLCETIDRYKPIAVIHLAGSKSIGESFENPAKYHLNNVSGSIVLFDVMREKKIDKVVVSSSAGVYGIPRDPNPIKESEPCDPVSPYGTSKWIMEKILFDFHQAYPLRYVVFRYFNVAGADLNQECGERGTMPHNLVPIVMQVAGKKRKELEIFGDDYSTPDGTAIRDYLHVVDLADAHIKALKYLLDGKPSIVLNLGTGKGASVKEIIEIAREITQQPIPTKQKGRRLGDPPYLTADFELARRTLGWEPLHSDLTTIIESEWKWMQR